MRLRRANFEIYSVLLVISLGILVHGVSEAQINLTTSGLRVTDVNTTAFSLVWVANQAATSSAKVYADPNGNQPIEGLTIKDESFDHPPAGQNGVMKVSISGLAPDTTYYYQIVTISTGAILVEPASGVLPSVRTELITTPVSNDSLAHRILQSDGSTPALGALLLAEVEGGNYPVTGWVADGIPAPWALVNLNNIFSVATHENLELFGGEAITLVSIGGLMGFQNISAQVPVETGGFQTLVPAPSDEQCTLTGGSDADNDSIPDQEEYGPDGTDDLYDGNNDTIPDSQQDTVASFHTYDRRSYVTLEVFSPVGATLSKCSAFSPPGGAPSGMSFPYGFFEFTINGAPTPPAETVARLFLPDGDATSYYKYGQTLVNPTDHWYEFLYDGETGAEINGNVITLHFVDTERGDDMLSQDGMIIDQGGPGIPASGGNTPTATSGGGGGGGGGGCFIATASDNLCGF